MKAVFKKLRRKDILIAYLLYYLFIAILAIAMKQIDFGYSLKVGMDKVFLLMDIFLLFFAFFGAILAFLSINTNLNQRTLLSMILSFIFLDFPTLMLSILSFYALLICNVVI